MADTTPKTRVLIVDDDAPSRQIVAKDLTNFDWVEVCGTVSGARQLLSAASALKPDLIFLDIELDDQSALDFIPRLKTVVSRDCKIVFYTTYNKYLMQALRMEAFDFLLKPYDTSELELIMNRYRMAMSGKGQVSDPAERLSSSHFIPGAPAGISVTTITNDRMILFPKDIVFFRYDTDRKLWEVVLNTLQHIIPKRNTTADTILKYGPQFVRTHKSYIVNVAYISMISGNECRLVPPYHDLSPIKISKVYRAQLLDLFYDL